MEVLLTSELERWVSRQVDGVRYSSASEVVREGPRLLQTGEEALDPKALEALTFEELAEWLERDLQRPLLPNREELRRRSKESLRRAEEHLRRSPIGRGEWKA